MPLPSHRTLASIRRRAVRSFRKLVHRDRRRASRERARLENLPRRTPTTTTLLGTEIRILDAPSYLGMYSALFERAELHFHADTDTPYIIDGGANIGMATIYFKTLHPGARVVAFEPDPQAFEALQHNLGAFGLHDVEAHRLGLWSSEGSVSFMREGADGGRIAQADDEADHTIRTVRLRPFLDRPVDFLKLDIEGAEVDVLHDVRDLLGWVRCLFVEYHSFEGQPQRLHELLEILGEAGFRISLKAWAPPKRPFLKRRTNLGMDLQVDVAGWRPGG